MTLTFTKRCPCHSRLGQNALLRLHRRGRAAGVFALVTSFGNITLSIFIGSGADVTLPVQMFTYVEQSSMPVLAAASTLVIIITMGIIGIVERSVGVERIT